MSPRGFSRRQLLAACLASAACSPAPREPGGRWIDVVRGGRDVTGLVVARVRRGREAVIEASGDLSPASVLEVASLSKPVFAYAVVAESKAGGIDLDAPLSKIAPPPYRHVRFGGTDDFADPRLAAVTPRVLLSHRSGLPNWSRAAPLAFVDAPGAAFRYSGEGYVLLQRAIEAGRRESLDAFVRRRALDPLGMTGATFDPRRQPAREPGHDRKGLPEASTVDAEVAATSLLCTAGDYARFARRLLDAPDDDPVVSTMLARQVDVDRALGIGWGVGIALADPEWMFHWGVNPGFRSLLVGSRKRGEAMVVLTDADGGMEAAADLVRDRFGDLPLLRFPMMYPPE